MSPVVLNLETPPPSPFGACGAFGKIAAAGDFIRFGLARDFVARWDAWLQAEIRAARGRMGRRWEETYLSAPIWRFTLAPGLAGAAAALGVLMPSTDRVGRMFPLTLALPVAAGQPLAEAHFGARACFEALEEIALTTLDDLPLDALREGCAALRPPTGTAPAPDGTALLLPGAWDAAPALAARQMPQGPGQCLWSARLSDGMRLLRSDGLPTGALFEAMFDPASALWRGARA